MSKLETWLVSVAAVLGMTIPLYGEITIGLVKSVKSNAEVRLLHRNATFVCEPLGVIPLEKMPAAAPVREGCRNAIEQWYRSHPSQRDFAARHLQVEQGYRFERSLKGCVLYANGPESYSEMLLARGLAVVDPSFDDKEWNSRLARAQKGAERDKNGLHETAIREACFKKEE